MGGSIRAVINNGRVPYGCYKIGRVAAAEEPGFLTNDVTHDPRVHNHDWARELGLVSFAGYRLMSHEGAPIGVLALFSKQALSQREKALLQTIAGTASEVILVSKSLDALQESRDEYHDLYETAPNAYFSISASNASILRCNANAAKLLGYEKEALKQMNVFDLYADTPNGRSKAQKVFKRFNTGKIMEDAELQMKHRDGHPIWISLSAIPIQDHDGNIIEIRSTVIDISDRKKMEEVALKAKKLESLGTLAGGIAHDFNNLLSVIIVNISLAQEDIKPEVETFTFLKEAEKASMRAKDLAARLITFSKGGEPVKKLAPIGELVRDSINSSLNSSDISYEFSILDDLSLVEIDVGQMKQVMHNIVINAMEAMAGGGMIKVCCENVAIGEKESLPLKIGSYVKISITDPGIGISEENLPKIFDPYFSNKEMGTQKGMGLGLSVCHSIVEKHHGLITVESELGKGTTIFIYLPASDKEIPKMEPSKMPVLERPVTGRGKVLLMDDEKMIRDFALNVLSRLRYDAEVSKDGAEAIELYQKAKESGEPFDVVILDLTNQFGMGGEEAIEKLLDIDPDVKGIVSTGYSYDPVVTNYREYGFCSVLTKPYSIDELSKILYDLILR